MMFGWTIFLIGFAVAGCFAQRIDTEEAAMSFLKQYGYMHSQGKIDGILKTSYMQENSLAQFQKFYNITVTGVLDNKTYEMMNLPRCGVPDVDTEETGASRERRYALRSRWGKKDLTWRIRSWTRDMPADVVNRNIADAFKVWSDVSSLTFREVSTGDADIIVEFRRRAHGDRYPFDGRGQVLAHAFFPSPNPIGGDAHFDDDELFTHRTDRGINLFQVAAHEFGHSLGLGHSRVSGALMAPYYRGYVPNFQLHRDDINGIQSHYGRTPRREEPETGSTPSTPLGDCMIDIAMATRTKDGSTYLANGSHVFRLVGGLVVEGYPKLIGDEFPGIPPNVDAALFYSANGKTFIFKGNQYWRMQNRVVEPGYPRLISSGFPRLPSDVSSAFIWSGNGRTYFTKGPLYYRITPGKGVDAGYPRPLSIWKGLPDHIDAALQYQNTQTYFFSGTKYYRYNDQRFNVDRASPPYPRNTATWWLRCNSRPLGIASETGNDATSKIPSRVTTLLLVLVCYVCGS